VPHAGADAVADTTGLSVDAAAVRLSEAVAPVLQQNAKMFARG
jgi:XRE family aerobic/anaerobic benzoate catabolism transcriptional regulator